MEEEPDDSRARDVRLMDDEDQWGSKFVFLTTDVVHFTHLKQIFLVPGPFPPVA